MLKSQDYVIAGTEVYDEEVLNLGDKVKDNLDLEVVLII